MSGNPQHARKRRGDQLARELDAFVSREVPDADAAEVRLGIFEFFERRTRTIRGASPWPDGSGEDDVDYQSPN